ncbi:MAG TPA: alpha/beta hydrolase [Actinomycetota bacterium]|nr:alpha/beta hydrolase [Actinomycetota bacterium]
MTEQDLGFIHRFEQGSGGPTLLLLHGTGGDENDLLPLGRALAEDATLVSPRGKVLEQGMPRFFRRLAMGVFDEVDLKERTHELAAFITDAGKVYGYDPSDVIVVGYSNGANIGASLLLLNPGLIKGSILLHAMVPFALESLPELDGTSVLITGGRRDMMIPGDQTEALAQMLEEAGADVTLEWQPGGHELTHAEVDAARRWLEAR